MWHMNAGVIIRSQDFFHPEIALAVKWLKMLECARFMYDLTVIYSILYRQ